MDSRMIHPRIPLLFMELAVGQYTRRGPIGALDKLCPILKGAGVGTVFISFFLCTYYNVILAWALFYLASSFQSPLPWAPVITGNERHERMSHSD